MKLQLPSIEFVGTALVAVWVIVNMPLILADTVPLRGTNTQAKGTFTIPGHQGTFAYRQVNLTQPPFPPPLPESSYGDYGSPRFKRILPDTYLLIVETNHTIVTTNKVSLLRRKGGATEIVLE